MKALRLLPAIAAGLILSTGLGLAQGGATQPGAPKPPPAKVSIYACPKCDVASLESGKCPCGETMVAIRGRILHVCEKCDVHKQAAADCKKCKTAMPKMAVTNVCEKCKVTAANKGKCKKCGSELKHKHVKMAG